MRKLTIQEYSKYLDKLTLEELKKLYNKGNQLINLNKKILELLKKVFNKDFFNFKDKFNAKPPGGEGFLHIMMAYFILLIQKMKKKRVGMKPVIFLSTHLLHWMNAQKKTAH